jgi:hypothetical protein
MNQNDPNIKVVKKYLTGFPDANIDEQELAMEIQEQESLGGWTLISSFGATTTHLGKTDTIVFIYRKK